MGLTLSVRPWDDGIIVAVSGEVDVCTEGPLQQVLLRIMRERSARVFLDVSGVSFMDCAGLRALLTTRRRTELRGGCMRLIATSAAVRRIIELTGAHDALAVERETRSVLSNSFYRTDQMRHATEVSRRRWVTDGNRESHELRGPGRGLRGQS
jgi:anti-sigma B factor antagonist